MCERTFKVDGCIRKTLLDQFFAKLGHSTPSASRQNSEKLDHVALTLNQLCIIRKRAARSRQSHEQRAACQNAPIVCSKDDYEPFTNTPLPSQISTLEAQAVFEAGLEQLNNMTSIQQVHALFINARMLATLIIISTLQSTENQNGLLAALPVLLEAIIDETSPLSYSQCAALLDGITFHLASRPYELPSRLVRRKWILLAKTRPVLFLDHIFVALVSPDRSCPSWVTECVNALNESAYPSMLLHLLDINRLGVGVIDFHVVLGQKPHLVIDPSAQYSKQSSCHVLKKWLMLLATDARTFRTLYNVISELESLLHLDDLQQLIDWFKECMKGKGRVAESILADILNRLQS